MKATKFAAAIIAVTAISGVTTSVMAYESGDWLVRGRVINVNPFSDSGPLHSIAPVAPDKGVHGEGASVNKDIIPELDITYMISPNWGVELILGYSEHTVSANKGLATLVAKQGSEDVINTKILPPTLTLQYHFTPNTGISPYIGAGINYTHFFDAKIPENSGIALTSDKALKKDRSGSVKLDGTWGLAVQAGVDIALNDDWFVNLDVKYIDISTTATFKNIAIVPDSQIDTDIDPLVFGIGIGRRF